MLIDFFYTLRSAKLPVSVKEYLTLLEALQANVVGPNSDDAYKIDDFYYFSRAALVKDEKQLRQVRQGLRRLLQGRAGGPGDFDVKDVPLEWLKRQLQREFTAEEKAAIEAMGCLDELHRDD
jgi:uncharacterized protein with von Willebrand factor type A (vWA) domain